MAIALQPDFLEARNNLALVYLHLGLYAKALDELERVLSCSADNAGTYFNLALVYLRGFNDSARAVFYLKEGLKLTSHRTPDELVDAAMKGFERDRTLEN
jgi:tetratricopeptide (TPR) repeat protein